jgi:hypothetical protein
MKLAQPYVRDKAHLAFCLPPRAKTSGARDKGLIQLIVRCLIGLRFLVEKNLHRLIFVAVFLFPSDYSERICVFCQ